MAGKAGERWMDKYVKINKIFYFVKREKIRGDYKKKLCIHVFIIKNIRTNYYKTVCSNANYHTTGTIYHLKQRCDKNLQNWIPSE